MDTGDSRWTVYTDENGFRVGREHPAGDGRPVLLWLGDSFAFGYGVDYDVSFVGLLAADGRTPYRHVDAAVGGYGPVQYRQTLEYLLDRGLRPRVVLVGVFLGNDFTDLLEDKDLPVHDGILGDQGGVASFLKRHSHLYRLAAATIHRLHPHGVSTDLEQNAQAGAWTAGELRGADAGFRREFGRIAAVCRGHGAKLAVLLIPSSAMVNAIAKGTIRSAGGAVDQTLPLQHALAALRDLQIRTLDVTPALVQRPVGETYFYFDGHLTPRGHALVRDAVARAWGDLLGVGP
jgi:SGNH hydrolase-like domain, acetyltransferase AlgX